MIAYEEFVALAQSGDSEDRCRAARLAAEAYLHHAGPADEQAALYAALVGFLDDPSVKVRAALAYGLLHAREAPRPIILALLEDNGVIARAVAQYSPVLVDADLMGLIRRGDPGLWRAMALREKPSGRVIAALAATGDRHTILDLLGRRELDIPGAVLETIASRLAPDDAALRGALLARSDLPAGLRLRLVRLVAEALRGVRLVRGAVAPERLDVLLSRASDSALAEIGEREAGSGRSGFAAAAISAAEVNARVLIHAVITGRVLFFADCLAELSGTSRAKVYALLDRGGRSALGALFARAGFAPAQRPLLTRLIELARLTDLHDDVAARHFVVTALTEELLIEHAGAIPPELEEIFCYLSRENVLLAREAARGVVAGFAREEGARVLPQAPEAAMEADADLERSAA